MVTEEGVVKVSRSDRVADTEISGSSATCCD